MDLRVPCGPRAGPTTARRPPSAPRQPTDLVLPSLSPLLIRDGQLRARRRDHERPRLSYRILVARTSRRRCGLGHRIAGFHRASARATDARVVGEVLVQEVSSFSGDERWIRLSRRRTRAGCAQIERHHRRQNGTNDFPPSVLADRSDACACPRRLPAPIRSSITGSRTRTGELSPDRSWMDGIAGLLLRMRSAGRVPVDANPQYGEPLGGGQSVGGVRNRLGRRVSDRPLITVHLFGAPDDADGDSDNWARKLVARARSATQHARAASSIPLRDARNPAILIARCGPTGSPPPIPSVGPVARIWRIGSKMQSDPGSPLEHSGRHVRVVLRPSGALDASASHDLREAISRAVSRGPAALVIDLSSVSAVDAVGIDVLVYAGHAATAAHAKLVLFAPSPLVLHLLEPMRLTHLCDFEFEPAVPVPIRRTAA
jgi:anti-anti-sigma factor